MFDLASNLRLGVSLSGGADSAILSYLLCLHTDAQLHFHTLSFKDKYHRSITSSTKVVQFLQHLYPTRIVGHTLHSMEKYSRDFMLAYWRNLVESGEVDVVVNATTSMPPMEVLATFPTKIDNFDLLARRSALIKKPLWSTDRYIYSPWMNLTKKDIRDLYVEYGMLDSLFPLTVSCEAAYEVQTHCRACVWCSERFWAFGRYE